MNLIIHVIIHLLHISLVTCYLSISLDNPPFFAKKWKSIPRFYDYSRQFQKNSIQEHIAMFRSDMMNDLYDVFIRDWKTCIPSVRKWINIKYNKTFSEIEKEYDDLMWNEWTMSDFSIGIQVPLDPNHKIQPRLVIENEGCTHIGESLDDSVSSPFAYLFNHYDERKGLVSCDRICPEASQILLHQWIPRKDEMKLMLYNPKTLSSCSTLTLFTLGIFEKFALTQISVDLDDNPIWCNSLLGLAIGKENEMCASNLDNVLNELPMKDRLSMRDIKGGKECETILQNLPPKEFISFYDNFLKQESDIEWPTAYDIVDATAPRLNLFKKSCKEWRSISLMEQHLYIPLLNAKGPLIKNVYDLSHYAMKLGSVAPSFNASFDELVSTLSVLCKKCNHFDSISFKSIYDSFRSILHTPCKESILGGNGQSVLKILESKKQSFSLVSQGMKRKATWKHFSYQHYDRILVTESCPSTTAIEFTLPLHKDSEYVDDYGTNFNAKFFIQSDQFQIKRSFNGTGVWLADTNEFTMILHIGSRELTGFYSMKAILINVLNLNKTIEIQVPIVCGYNSKLSEIQRIQSKSHNPLAWLFLSFGNLLIPSSITVPLKYHGLL